MTRLAEARAALDAARQERTVQPLDLFSTPEPIEPARTTAAIETVARHAPTEWKQRALDAVGMTAERLELLTVDDVRPVLPDDVYDARALGSVMRTAAHRGWIESTRTYRPSQRPETHRRPLLVWRSRLRGEL